MQYKKYSSASVHRGHGNRKQVMLSLLLSKSPPYSPLDIWQKAAFSLILKCHLQSINLLYVIHFYVEDQDQHMRSQLPIGSLPHPPPIYTLEREQYWGQIAAGKRSIVPHCYPPGGVSEAESQITVVSTGEDFPFVKAF